MENKLIAAFPLRKSVAIIGAAMLLSMNAQAVNRNKIEVHKTGSAAAGDGLDIGRLPSTNAASGQVIGAKPNVFLVIDNNELMTGSPRESKFDPNGNYLQQTAAALIASLPQLEGKVRLGYTTVFRGFDTFYLRFKNPAFRCLNLKLSGNVNRLQKLADDGIAPELKNIRKDLESNSNYVTADDDFVFGPWGSGVGETTPRDFRDNYARYIYSWLGAMCPGSPSPHDKKMPYSNMPASYPPYADLKDRDAYIQAAEAAGNRYSFPTFNFAPSNIFSSKANSLFDPFTRILGEVSDERFLCSLMKNYRGGSRCGYTNLSAERSSPAGVTLRQFPGIGSSWFFKYDAYAPARADNGYPDDKNPLSCRKNYTIMIAKDIGSFPDQLESNSNVGITHLRQANNTYDWEMGDGRNFPTTGRLGEITKMYRHLTMDPPSNASFLAIPREFSNTSAGAKFMISKLALQTYYLDLRSNLVNDVPPFYGAKGRRPGPDGRQIPRFWDRKNDTAPWQHITFFTLGFEDAFPAWAKSRIYNKNFPDLKYSSEELKKPIDERNPEEGALEAYFRAIETGLIERDNAPLYDWSRGGFGLKAINNQQVNRYFYKNPVTQQLENVEISPPDLTGGNATIRDNLIRGGALTQMDYAKAGLVGRGGSYLISDYNSIKKVIKMIADRIETAMAQSISGGAVSGGGGRVTASQQAAGGNDNFLFTTYLDQQTLSGNIFAFQNCPLIREKIVDSVTGAVITNPEWLKQKCGQRLWNAATVLAKEATKKTLASKTVVPVKRDPNKQELTGDKFIWTNLDKELKDKLSEGDEALGQARVEWVNGKLQPEFTDQNIARQLRQRSTVFIPDEQQNYKIDDQGNLVKDSQGQLVLADPTRIPNLMGEVSYAKPVAIANRGLLPATHPLNAERYGYADFVQETVKKRKPMVLAGSNDGRFYAFNTSQRTDGGKGGENATLAFSFIPRSVITKNEDNLARYTGLDPESVDQNFKGLLNGPFYIRDARVNGKWGTYVVGTIGEGGKSGIYALDISTGQPSSDLFKWEITPDSEQGRSYGNIMAPPRIIWINCRDKDLDSCKEGKWVVVFPSGYNAADVSLVILDLADGSELARIKTGARYKSVRNSDSTLSCRLLPNNGANDELYAKLVQLGDPKLPKSAANCANGLGPLTPFDANSDNSVDYIFTGDLMGHVWKFDLTELFKNGRINPDKAKVSYNSPLFIAQTAKDQGATRQPISAKITIDDGASGEGSMLYFGTGRLFSHADRDFEQQESFYGVWDVPRYAAMIPSLLPLRRDPPAGAKYNFLRYTTFEINKSQVASHDSSLTRFKEIRGVKRVDTLNKEQSDYLTYKPDEPTQPNGDGEVVGWIIDFMPQEGDKYLERVVGQAFSFEDAIFFPTFTPKGGTTQESCNPVKSGTDGDARFYMVDRLTGGQLETSPFDFTGDGQQNSDDGVKVQKGDINSSDDHPNDTTIVAPAGIMVGSGSGDFLPITGVLSRSEQAALYQCDYVRQVVFPSTVDPQTGNPLILNSCNSNRYRVWKQPVIE